MGKPEGHPSLYNVKGPGGPQTGAAREDSEKPCKYFPPSQECFKYFGLCITISGNSVGTFELHLLNNNGFKTSYS